MSPILIQRVRDHLYQSHSQEWFLARTTEEAHDAINDEINQMTNVQLLEIVSYVSNA